MLSAIRRRYLDTLSEREALRLLEADTPVIDQWRAAVHQNINARRGRWADVAYLKRQRVRRFAA
jgi:hypothetical protein